MKTSNLVAPTKPSTGGFLLPVISTQRYRCVVIIEGKIMPIIKHGLFMAKFDGREGFTCMGCLKNSDTPQMAGGFIKLYADESMETVRFIRADILQAFDICVTTACNR